jgi:hypothetical protein
VADLVDGLVHYDDVAEVVADALMESKITITANNAQEERS